MAFIIKPCMCTRGLVSFARLRRLMSTDVGRSAKPISSSASPYPARRNEKKDPEALEIKEKVFEAALPFVSVDGWSRETIIKGAKAAGLPSVAHGLFEAGGVDLVAFFYMKCNGDLHKWMLEEKERRKTIKDTSKTSLIRDSVQQRLRMLEPYEDRWPEAMGLLTTAPKTGLLVLTDLVDDIWHVAGEDTSVDWNWYTKRLALVGVYESTQVFMLQDTSPNRVQTWDFLDRRMANLFQATGLAKGVTNMVSMGSGAAVGLGLSMKNMLGLNQWLR